MIVKEWESSGLECVIRRVKRIWTSHPCGYVVIPKEHWYAVSKAANEGEFEANGDITYIGEMPEPDDDRLCIGFDMAHGWDGHYEGYRWICERTDEDCECETNRLAKQVCRFVEALGAER